MKKEYLKPEAEYVSLVALEAVTSGGGLDVTLPGDIDPELGLESSIF